MMLKRKKITTSMTKILIEYTKFDEYSRLIGVV